MARGTPADAAPTTYSYVAVSPSGARVKATVTGVSESAVSRALQAEGWIPVEVKAVAERRWNIDIGAVLAGGSGPKLKFAPRADFARRLHNMLRAGIAVPKALVALGEDAPAPVAAMCNDLADRVQSGTNLSTAMAAYPRAFDEIFCAYLQAGEESGTLVETTARLAAMLAKRASLQHKIKSVTAYPKMVAITIGVLVTGIILFLVPMYARIYASFGAKLPGPTEALVVLSRHFTPIGLSRTNLFGMAAWYPVWHPFNYASILVYLLAGWLLFLRQTRDSLRVGIVLDKIRFRLPVFGRLNHRLAMFRWSSTLAGGLASSVPTARAIELAAAASGSRWHASIAPEMVENVRSGRMISEALRAHPDLYPPNVRTMLSTGEEVGEVAEMLHNVALTLDDEVDSIIAGLSAKIEVALIIALGLVVGSLLMVLYLPILNLANTVMKGYGAGS